MSTSFQEYHRNRERNALEYIFSPHVFLYFVARIAPIPFFFVNIMKDKPLFNAKALSYLRARTLYTSI